MDKISVKGFARSARRQLVEDMEQRLFELGLSRSNIAKGEIPPDECCCSSTERCLRQTKLTSDRN